MLNKWFSKRKGQMAAVHSRVEDSPGWMRLSAHPHERDYAEMQGQYADALTAWRKNPLAWRIIALTTDYVVGEDFRISSPVESLQRFIQAFWDHPKNRLELRLGPLAEELARSGDLFVVLFRNPLDGMSYLRCLTKDAITRIETLPNDWETETAFYEQAPGELEPRRWLSPAHPEAAGSEAVMLHYAVNRPLGALMGESDLATLIPWLLRYSRMLEDRVRLHWAARAFLYLVTVPSNKVESKSAQYAAAPESGAIVVKDEAERWETVTPSLRGADASHDMKAVRSLIDAGSGYPPHWRGEGGDVNLATAEAMQSPPEKHLQRRQQYFAYVLMDILYQAYQRAAGLGFQPPLPSQSYAGLFRLHAPDVSTRDNLAQAQAAQAMAAAMQSLAQTLQSAPPELRQVALELVLQAAGKPLVP